MADPSVEDHLGRILALVEPVPTATVALDGALGTVTAEDVTAAVALPRFDHAAMDGYAVRAIDVAGASADAPVSLPVVGVIAAGAAWPGPLAPGTALRIMTGAAAPEGADAVVPFEWTDRGDPVLVSRAAGPGRHLRRAGEDVAAGAVAVPSGRVLAPRHLGLLAAVGRRTVVVRPEPRVAIVSTGAELVAAGARAADIAADAVHDSNTVAIAAAARSVGAAVTTLGPVHDDPAALLARLTVAADLADLVITTGGISAGDHDVVKATLGHRATTWFGPVALRPGRPQGCGTLPDSNGSEVPVVCLPGTPVAAYSSFLLFVAPAIRALAGKDPVTVTAVLAHEVRSDPSRTVLLPGRYDDAGRVAVLPGHAGHSQRLVVDADVLVVVPPGEAPLAAGAAVAVLSA